MPLYEYQCPNDGRFEVIRKFSDPLLTNCPTCGAEVQKLLSAPAIQFKGTGWYVTDYARKGSSGGESKDGGKDSGKDSGKSDSGKGDSGKSDAAKTESGSGKSDSNKSDSSSSSSTSSSSDSGSSGTSKPSS